MSAVLEALARLAARRPDARAVSDGSVAHSWSSLHRAVLELAARLRKEDVRRMGLLADNGPDWVIADLAALAAGVCVVPLPTFFTPSQQAHALRASGADALLLGPGFDAPVSAEPCQPLPGDTALRLVDLDYAVPRPALPPGTRKISFTSGTTGEPKGVCLGVAEMERVAEGLCAASGAGSGDVHLGVMPLSTLLENIGGVYAPILAGATSVQRPLAEVGLQGVTGLDAPKLVQAMNEARATTAIIVPQILAGLLGAIRAGIPRPGTLRFLAVGGAPIASTLLDGARAASLPVHEGYGLSECASVVALNRVGSNRPGTVGRPLAHLRVSIAPDGEIVVSGNGYRGYVGEAVRDASEPVATGDLGAFDADGYLRITGRRKNLFITAFGRNVAPEWIESELCAHPAIAQAAVFGEARPWNVAVIVPRPGAGSIDEALRAVNAGLPDYAQVRRWITAPPFTAANGQATTNGRVRRAQVASDFNSKLHAIYEEDASR